MKNPLLVAIARRKSAMAMAKVATSVVSTLITTVNIRDQLLMRSRVLQTAVRRTLAVAHHVSSTVSKPAPARYNTPVGL